VWVGPGEQGVAATREPTKPSKIDAEFLSCVNGGLPARTLGGRYGEPVSPLIFRGQGVKLT
jgi:hypothetical protein